MCVGTGIDEHISVRRELAAQAGYGFTDRAPAQLANVSVLTHCIRLPDAPRPTVGTIPAYYFARLRRTVDDDACQV